MFHSPVKIQMFTSQIGDSHTGKLDGSYSKLIQCMRRHFYHHMRESVGDSLMQHALKHSMAHWSQFSLIILFSSSDIYMYRRNNSYGISAILQCLIQHLTACRLPIRTGDTITNNLFWRKTMTSCSQQSPAKHIYSIEPISSYPVCFHSANLQVIKKISTEVEIFLFVSDEKTISKPFWNQNQPWK